MLVSALALLFATAPLPAETDRAYAGSGTLLLGDQRLRLDGVAVLRPDGSTLVDALTGAPVADGEHLCAADEGEGGVGRLRCWSADGPVVTIATGGRPGRLALHDGMVAYVASPQGFPSVRVAPVDGSAPPRALTNVDLKRVPGQAPAGFVPPPLRDTLRFDGPLLRWQSAEGAQAVAWR
jgi:hypothetical protein